HGEAPARLLAQRVGGARPFRVLWGRPAGEQRDGGQGGDHEQGFRGTGHRKVLSGVGDVAGAVRPRASKADIGRRTAARSSGTVTAVAILLFPWIIAATALGAQDPRRPWTVAGGGPGVEATVRQVEAALPGIVRELQQHVPGTPARPFRVVVHSDPSSLPPGVLEHLHPGTPGLALLARDEIHLIRSELRVAP